MKILFLAEKCHPSTQGGIQTFGRALKKIFSSNLIFLSYATRSRLKLFDVSDSIEVGSSSFLCKAINKVTDDFFYKFLYKKEIKKMKPDVCILRSPQDLKILKDINCKKILVQHISFNLYMENFYKNDFNLLEKSKKELFYFIVTSPKDKEKLIKDFSFPKEKVKVIRHSCDTELFNGDKTKNKILIMIARLDNRHKRFDLAIKAMKSLSDFNLKIYGSGPDKDILEKLIIENNIKNVELCGPTNQVKEKLDEASIFVMTSDFEGYPVTTIEAMRRGLPIILRDTFEGASDVVIDNGVLLGAEWNEKEFCDGIRKIYDNYEFYSKNSIEMGKRHNLDVVKKEWEKILDF